MRIDKTKLYAGLSLAERAKLAFIFTAANDDAGLDAILATIPKKTYSTNHQGFAMRGTSLYQAALAWGFQYQKWQGLNTSFYLFSSIANDSLKIDPDNKQFREIANNATKQYEASTDKLAILFSLLEELDTSHGLDVESVHAIAEIRNVLVVGKVATSCPDEAEIKTPVIAVNHDTKNKNQVCRDYYSYVKDLLLQILNQYENTLNSTDSDVEDENEKLRARIKELETEH